MKEKVEILYCCQILTTSLIFFLIQAIAHENNYYFLEQKILLQYQLIKNVIYNYINLKKNNLLYNLTNKLKNKKTFFIIENDFMNE